jgi:hypothetical protein
MKISWVALDSRLQKISTSLTLQKDIIKSSARAWEHGGSNYTDEMARQRIQDSIASNGTLTPFLDGAAWEGREMSPSNSLASETYEII